MISSPLFTLGTFLILGTPALGAQNDKTFMPPIRPPVSPRLAQQPKPKPVPQALRVVKPSPFERRLNQAYDIKKKENEAARKTYPPKLGAPDLQLILNARLKQIDDMRTKKEAVFIRNPSVGTMKISVKAPDAVLRAIKGTIDERVLNGDIDSLNVDNNTQITVHPSITAQFYQVCQLSYKGGTAQEEEERTGKKKKGQLIEYDLMQGSTPLQYFSEGAKKNINARLMLSITVEE